MNSTNTGVVDRWVEPAPGMKLKPGGVAPPSEARVMAAVLNPVPISQNHPKINSPPMNTNTLFTRTPRSARHYQILWCLSAVSCDNRLWKNPRVTARILPFLLLCFCGRVSAFNGWEHETISQLSLLVASNHVSVTLGGLTNANDRLAVMRETVSSFYEGLPETAEWRKPDSPP